MPIKRVSIDVAINVPDEQHTIGNRWSSVELRANQQVVETGQGGAGGRVHHNHGVALRGRDHPGSRGCHRPEHRPIAHAVLPEIASIVRIDLAHTAHATAAANGCFAPADVEIMPIPGTGRDGTITTLGAITTSRYLGFPDWTGRNTVTVKSVILAILVGHPHHVGPSARREERGCRAEIAVARPLNRWQLEVIRHAQV